MKATRVFPPPSLALCLLFAGGQARGQQDVRRDAPAPQPEKPACTLCPTVIVECPKEVSVPGVPVKFSAKISGAGGSPSLTLKWDVSAGVIAPGQEASQVTTPDSVTEITVDTTGLPRFSTVVATVEVNGLDRACTNFASCSTEIHGVIDWHAIDTYGDIKNFEDEAARLDNFAIELQYSPELRGYVICYGGRVGKRGEAAARCERAKKYLVDRRGVAPDRVLTFDGGFRESQTVALWILPPDAKPPLVPTVDQSEVRFTGGARKRGARAARRQR